MADDTPQANTGAIPTAVAIDPTTVANIRKEVDSLLDSTKDANVEGEKLLQTFIGLGTVKFADADAFFKGFKESIGSAGDGVGKIDQQWTAFKSNLANSPIADLGSKFQQLTSLASQLGISTAQITQGMQLSGKSMGDATTYMTNLIESKIQAVQIDKELAEQTIINAGKIGDLNTLIVDGTNNFDNITKKIEDTRRELKNLSNTTGVSEQNLATLYSSISRLPRSFDETGKAIDNFSVKSTSVLRDTGAGVTDAASQQERLLGAFTQVAAGSGLSLSEVYNKVQGAMKNYNLSVENSLTYVAKESQASNLLGVSIDTVGKYMDDVSQKFGELGNNTDASTKLFETFESRLTQTGLSAEKAANIVTTFTDRIAGLDVAQRSFISQQSGGPGGLAGGFHITKLIQEGKLDEVAKMAEDTLKKQMGGRLTTLAEAESSEAGARQYQKQLMMLRQGPLGQFAQTDQDAMKLLESFGKEVKFSGEGNKVLGTKNDALAEVMNRGITIQQNTNNVMNNFNNAMQMFLYGREKGSVETGAQILGSSSQARSLASQNAYKPEDMKSSGTMMSAGATYAASDATVTGKGLENILGMQNKVAENIAASKNSEIQKIINESNDKNLRAWTENLQKTNDTSFNKINTEHFTTSEKDIYNKEKERREILSHRVTTTETPAPTYHPPQTPNHQQTPASTQHNHPTTQQTAYGQATTQAGQILDIFITCPACHEKYHANAHTSASATSGR